MSKVIKLFIIIISIILTTGCYNYQEVNSIDIITGIGIDYQSDEYIVTLEVLNNTGDKTAIKLDTSLTIGKGLSLSDALIKAANNLNKTPNYSHLKIMVVSENALKNKWFSIMDFFLRNTDFRENFYLVATSNKPNDIFSIKDNNTKITSVLLTNYLENQKYNTVSKKFEDYATDYLTFNKSLVFTNINIDDNKIIIDGATILNNDKTYYLNQNELETYNLFNKHTKKTIINNYYDNKVFSIVITDSNLKLSVNNNNILISGSINAKILNNEPNINIRDLKNIEMLNNDFKSIIIDDIKNLIKIIKELNSDIFGIDYMNYQKNRIKIKNYWLNQDININIDFNINKKGLIYEVYYEK